MIASQGSLAGNYTESFDWPSWTRNNQMYQLIAKNDDIELKRFYANLCRNCFILCSISWKFAADY